MNAPTRRAHGEIERLPSGSLRVRVYDGLDPSKKRRYLVETVPAGPNAEAEAEQVRVRLLEEAGARRKSRSRAAEGHGGGATPLSKGSGVSVPQGDDPQPPPPQERTLTVAAIARLAGVSAPTVSKVLNGRPGVSEATRSRVELLLREQGYRRPERVVRAASVEVVFYGMQGQLAVDVMRGVTSIVADHGLAAAFTDARHEELTGRSWARELLARRPTGVIAVHIGFTPEQHGLLTASGIPLVSLDPAGEPLHPVPSVAAANRLGGIAAAQHLLDLGHRRIGIITGPLERLCSRDRLEGTRAAMEAAGAPLEPRLLRKGQWFSFEEGAVFGRELLGLAEPPTAVVCGNDLQALGVYEAARQAGVRIPEDLSVVGFDDISYTRWCGPPMTTVRQPFADMGAAAAELVLALAAGESVTRIRTELAADLVVRASTAAPGS